MANRPTTRSLPCWKPTLAYGHIKDIKQCPKALVDRLKHYFLSYKQFPGDAPRRVEIVDVYDRAEALDVITRSFSDYQTKFGDHESRKKKLKQLI